MILKFYNLATILIFVLTSLVFNIPLAGQIFYNDFIPDKILQHTAYDSIDINSDGVYDLRFTQEDSVATSLGNANGVGVTLLHYDVEFVGLAPSYDPSHFYTYKLASYMLVDQNAGGQLWVTKLGPNDAVRVMQMFFYTIPFHLGEWINNVVDGYLGIRIKINNHWHYGWIRMDVDQNATMLTIKDFAYNEVPMQGIYTSQTNSYKPVRVEVCYVDSLCANMIGYERSLNSHLLYDKVYKMNSNGGYDSIGMVAPSAAPCFFDYDTNTILSPQQYFVSAVDSSSIEWQASDAIFSIYAEIVINSNNQSILQWSHYTNQNFSKYYIFGYDSLCHKMQIIDSVDNTLNSYLLPSSSTQNLCQEYQIRLALNAPLNINGNLFLDTISSNIATTANHYQLFPQAGFSAQIVLDSTYDIYQFTDTSKANIDSYYWDFGDGTTSTYRNPKHSFLPGVYTVSLTVQNCYGFDSIVKQHFIDVSSSIKTSIAADGELIVYPIPANNSLNIEANTIIREISLYSIDGKETISYGNFGKRIMTLDVSQLPTGFYFLRTRLENNREIYRKIMVR